MRGSKSLYKGIFQPFWQGVAGWKVKVEGEGEELVVRVDNEEAMVRVDNEE